jgi:ribosome modulation factor
MLVGKSAHAIDAWWRAMPQGSKAGIQMRCPERVPFIRQTASEHILKFP